MVKENKMVSKLKTVVLSLLLLFYMTPFAILLLNTFKNKRQIISDPLALPDSFKLNNFIEAFDKMNYIHAFFNTLIITVFSVFIIVIFSSMTAYLFVRCKWRFNKIMFFCNGGFDVDSFSGCNDTPGYYLWFIKFT